MRPIELWQYALSELGLVKLRGVCHALYADGALDGLYEELAIPAWNLSTSFKPLEFPHIGLQDLRLLDTTMQVNNDSFVRN